MSYSTAVSQGISIMLFIHVVSGGNCSDYLSARTIAEQLNIPLPTTVKVLRNLGSAGLTITKEGAKGGILPAKPISEITLLDIFMAVEHGKALFKVHTDITMQGTEVEAVKEKIVDCLQGVDASMHESLQAVKLSDFLQDISFSDI